MASSTLGRGSSAKVEPEGNRFEHEFDELGRLTDSFDENGGRWTFQRDADEQGNVHADTLTAEGAATSYLDQTKSTGVYASTMTDSFGTATSYEQSSDGLTVTKALSCGMELGFKYDLDPLYGYKSVTEMTEDSPAGLLKVTRRAKDYQDTDSDKVPDIITESTTVNAPNPRADNFRKSRRGSNDSLFHVFDFHMGMFVVRMISVVVHIAHHKEVGKRAEQC